MGTYLYLHPLNWPCWQAGHIRSASDRTNRLDNRRSDLKAYVYSVSVVYKVKKRSLFRFIWVSQMAASDDLT